MSAFPPPIPPLPSLWQEARAPDGRIYYYNTQTKATQWTKPAELMSPAERSLTQSAWKEYTTPEGRKYWHNAETNKTTWEMPDAYQASQPQTQSYAPAQPAKPNAPTFVAGGVSQLADSYRRDNRDDSYMAIDNRPSGYGASDGYRSSGMPHEEDFRTPEEAEAAFHKFLRRSGVQSDWTWEKTVRAVAKDAQFRAVKDAKDRRVSFDRYIAEVRSQERDRERERQAKLRADFFSMLRSHPEIQHYTRWKTAQSIVQGETIYRTAKNSDEAQSLFEEYRAELRRDHYEAESSRHKSALDRLTHLLKSLDLEPYTRWADVQNVLKTDAAFQNDEMLKFISKLDVLKAFESHVKALERSFNDKRQSQKSLKARKERQNRDAYIGLLKELRAAGKLKASTKWKDFRELIKDDPRYVAMLGQPGSSPLELFWDMVEDEDRVLRVKRNDALDVLEEKRYELTKKTTIDEFASVMKSDRRTASIDAASLQLIFERLREKVMRRSDEDRHVQRRAIDALRSRIKHLDPPVAAIDTWETVRPRVEKFEEYKALPADDMREMAFDKFMSRLHERDHDGDRDRERDRDRSHSKRDRERDRDRASRAGDSHRPSRHRSRSPEIDAYAADRKKAQADRERQFRKSSFPVSPPPPGRRSRDRDVDRYDGRDRDRERDRERERERGGDRYDGRTAPNRTRERERERGFVSRADPREAGASSELDYGDSKPAPVRRRRESDADREGREAKRPRNSREHTYSGSPRGAGNRLAETPKEKEKEKAKSKETEEAYKSGSEEGEIEEE